MCFNLSRAPGIRAIEAHMEARHGGVAEEDWAYTVVEEGAKRGREQEEVSRHHWHWKQHHPTHYKYLFHQYNHH